LVINLLRDEIIHIRQPSTEVYRAVLIYPGYPSNISIYHITYPLVNFSPP
jgi:hypothetical protein